MISFNSQPDVLFVDPGLELPSQVKLMAICQRKYYNFTHKSSQMGIMNFMSRYSPLYLVHSSRLSDNTEDVGPK